jgi:hypothetical protein
MTQDKTLNDATLLDIAEELTRRLRELEAKADALRFEAATRRADGQWNGTSRLTARADDRDEVAADLARIVEILLKTSREHKAVVEWGA